MEDLGQALLQGHPETQPCFGVSSVLEQQLPSWRLAPNLYLVSHEEEGGRIGVNLQAPGDGGKGLSGVSGSHRRLSLRIHSPARLDPQRRKRLVRSLLPP